MDNKALGIDDWLAINFILDLIFGLLAVLGINVGGNHYVAE